MSASGSVENSRTKFQVAVEKPRDSARARAHVQRMSLLRFLINITKQQRTKCLELCNVAPLREAQQPRREAITHNTFLQHLNL